MKSAIAVLLCVLMAEVTITVCAPFLSGNIKHINKIPQVAHDLARQNGMVDESVLFLGNSLIGNAINLKQFDKEITNGSSRSVVAYKVVPDGTSFWDWYCIFKNNFADGKSAPRTIVIGFAWEKEKPEPSRLAGHFCGLSDLPDLIELGMDDSSDVFEYIAASTSHLYALRETIHKRVLDMVVPYYREFAQKSNAVNREIAEKTEITDAPGRSYELVERFLDMLEKNGTRAVFIAMPVVKDYSLDPALVQVIENGKGVLYDYRHLAGISKDMFLDPIHLDSRGGEVFTRSLLNDLNRIVSVRDVREPGVKRLHASR